MLELPFHIKNSCGDVIRGDVRIPNDAHNHPVIIVLHGFKGFKDWGSMPFLCRYFAQEGFATISFNFSLNGIGENPLYHTELDKFERNTFSRELEDVQTVMTAISEKILPESNRFDQNRIGILGHSRGGGIAILSARNDKRFRAVSVWGSVSSFDRYSDRQRARWREAGVFETVNMRTGQTMPLGVGLLDDIETHRDALDIKRAVGELHRPLCIVHGEQDFTAKPHEAEELFENADYAVSELHLLPHTGHTFDATHPFTEPSEALLKALEITTTFFKKYL